MNAETAVGREPAPSGGLATLGWALGALLVAVALSFATNILFDDVLDAAIDPLAGGAVVPDWVDIVGSALIVGAAIGGVIGSRVHRGTTSVAAGVTIFYLALWPFAAFFARGAVVAVSVGVHLAAAVLTARWMQSRAQRS